ncbi:hypothetical protein LB572_04060 [Mesorhizobium sp. BH1-1-5]|uniref:hypothetical protein n=1 Tax=Mesorhizobium sp. BH1-1-5 TaxID=2876661 RepID=UPI001CCC62A0|nr:hypothetical protein [Mesorhizobium sp. BH1-1-5]MBZ9986266.1 hypothetical protein [Mesorhizobium sp. BH1-1-5]
MMASENRFTLFGIMLWSTVGRGLCRRQVDERACRYATPAIRRFAEAPRAVANTPTEALSWGLFFRVVKKIAILTRRLF